MNSLSWEFLNQDAEEEWCEGKVTGKGTGPQEHKEVAVKDKEDSVEDKLATAMKHPSTDSLYESEFDSSSTMESINSASSARLQLGAVFQQ